MIKQHFETADCADYNLLKRHAKENRRNPTEAESVMWSLLRRNSFNCKFRRQHIIGDYIADFVCISHSLVIEVDGGYHQEAEQRKLDMERTKCLENAGFIVIRFTNNEVISDTENVLLKIKKALIDNN